MKNQHRFSGQMRSVVILSILLLVLLVGLGPFDAPALAQTQDRSLMFIENVGQFPDDDPTRFQVNGGLMTLRLTEEAIWLTAIDRPALELETKPELSIQTPAAGKDSGQGVNLKLSFVGANSEARLEPFNRLDSRVAFIKGNDPAQWHPEVPVWGGVRYVDLYPGLDLELTGGEQGQLVQRLVVRDREAAVAQAESLQQVRLQVEGAEAVSVDGADRLRLATAVGEIRLPLLQVVGADNQPLDLGTDAAEVTATGEVKAPFRLSAEITAGPDPQAVTAAGVTDLMYSTFLGGEGLFDTGMGIAVDEEGYAYVTGLAYAGFPVTPGAFDPTIEGDYNDLFVAKVSPDGRELIFSTFIGGDDYEYSRSIEVDQTGQVYITGNTHSANFPTTPESFDPSFEGQFDAFLVKLNPTGTDLVYATFLGGSGGDFGWDLVVDSAGAVYTTGSTASDDFPVSPWAADSSYESGEAYVAKISADGSNLIYATFLGGVYGEYGYGLAVDHQDNAYVTGWTVSPDFPVTAGALDTAYEQIEGFLAKLSPDGSELVYSTFIGGSQVDYGYAVAIDGTGHAYVTGLTGSTDFPLTAGAFDDTCTGCNDTPVRIDGFVAKVAVDGSSLVYSSFLGGSSYDYGRDIAVSEAGSAYVTGYTNSADFPVTPDSFDPVCESCSGVPAGTDAFLARIHPAGTALAYSSFLGGSQGSDRAESLVIDNAGQAYLVGTAGSPDFPITEGAFDSIVEGSDVFVAKLATGSDDPQPEPTPTPLPAHDCAPTHLGEITVGDRPRGVAIDSDRGRIYVANYGSNSVSVIDSATNSVLHTLTGITSANGVAYDQTQNIIWVTNYELNLLTPIQANEAATDFVVLPAISVGRGPWGVAYEPVHNYVYVANSLDNSVTVVDAATQSSAATVGDFFNQPFHLAANPATGKVYVANFGQNSVTVLEGTGVSRVTQLWDSGPAYGIAVDETRNLVYVATINSHRIVVIGPLHGQPDRFLGWAAFQRGFNPNRPVPLRVLAVNPDIGPAWDGGHLWATTSAGDGSEANQVLFIPKGWSSYFHAPFAHNVAAEPTEGIAIDGAANRVYVTSGISTGIVTVMGDHATVCPGIAPATVPAEADSISLDIFSMANLLSSDVTGDGQVDIRDLSFIASRYGTDDPQADINDDGTVDIRDLALVAGYYKQRIPAE